MNEEREEGRASFRDTVSIVDRRGKRRWIYPRKAGGPLTRARALAAVVLLGILFGVPFLRTEGHPFMLFDIPTRRFILFGTAFGPYDYYLFALGFITLAVFILLFTAVFGRIFCGWICPQTVFMEMVFRPIEYLLEGDHRAQRRLNGMPWTGGKLLRKGAKYAVYFGISFLISNILLAWIIGVEKLMAIVTDPPGDHLAGLAAMLVFSGVFYWIFIWFREQACILVCPYGRLQGVLLDAHSIVIAYDHVRGEPREPIRRGKEKSGGDCIACNLCVDVCPTGIDIRNGTQLECVNCTACIDACNAVMAKVRRPKGLIRYDSALGIASGRRRIFTPRVAGYAALFLMLAGTLTVLASGRQEVELTVLRTPGMFYQEHPDGRVSNLYDVKIINKTFKPATLELRLMEPEGELEVLGGAFVIPPQAAQEQKLMVYLRRGALKAMSTPLVIGVFRNGEETGAVRSSFLGPAGRK
ncbi:MAG: cytochrome c oxidase accessory protein CcoG [Bacteroidota bacterium]